MGAQRSRHASHPLIRKGFPDRRQVRGSRRSRSLVATAIQGGAVGRLEAMSDATSDHGDPALMIDLVRDQLAFQAAGADAAETKAGIYFAVGSTLLGVLVAVVALNPPATPWAVGCACAVAAWYVVLTVLCLAVYRAEKWQIGPDVRDLAATWGTRSARGNQAAVLQTLLRDYNHNLTPYSHKMIRTRYSAICLAAETLSLGLLSLVVARGF